MKKLLLVTLIVVLCGCQQAAPPNEAGLASTVNGVPIEGGVPAIEKTPDEVTAKAREFFSEWLEGHGQKEIVNDETGVGVASNGTRLWAFQYQSELSTGTETEFRIVLPDGREIQEFLAGIFGGQDDPVGSALLNFTLTTFHTVYAACIDKTDDHVGRKDIVLGGTEFQLVTTGLTTATNLEDELDFRRVRDQITMVIESAGLKPSNQLHWMKIVYGHANGEMITPSVTFDNAGHQGMTRAIEKLEWPEVAEGFYLAKQFIMFAPKDK